VQRIPIALLALLELSVGAVNGQEPADSSRTALLFDTNELLELRLTADLGAIAKDRDTTTKHDHPGVLTYVSAAGDTVSLDVQLQTRGHFRLRTCQYPPLKLSVSRERAAGTLFARQKNYKLVVQCRGGQGYANYVLEEYLIYRMYNLLTDLSFRVRLAKVTYVIPGKNDPPETRYAFFIEDDDRVARRNRGQVFAQQGVTQEETEPDQMALLGVFEYLIGNTDWSVAGLHNIVLVRDSVGTMFPVPYDFDWSGVISTPYAFPDSRLGIRTVRERLYRATCRTLEDLAPALASFTSHKEAIYGLYRGQEGLEAKRVKQALEYYDEFYRIINDARATQRALMVTCAVR
jgi:hypothetical protein